MSQNPDLFALVADIGGTHVRFALWSEGEGLGSRQTLFCADFASPAEAVQSYLGSVRPRTRPAAACFAVAAPVDEDRVEMTNQIWRFSVQRTRRQLGLDRLEVINDFAATALAVPALGPEDRRRLKEGEARADSPVAVLGPGTGLGVSALIPAGGGRLALSTEGGHRDLAARNEREWQIVQVLRHRFGHVSAERVLSGPGLVALHQAIAEANGRAPEELEPDAVVARATLEREGVAEEALSLFSGWLGAVAGDLVLTLGARGGVYLGGGILPRLGANFDEERFRSRFLDKGRFRAYLEPVPVDLITSEDVALEGAAAYLIAERNSTTMLAVGR